MSIFISRELIVHNRQGTQQQRPESRTVTPLGMQINTGYINSTKGVSCLCSLNLHRHSRPRTVSDYYCSDDDYYYNCSDASNDGNGDDDFHCQRTVCSVAGCGLRTSSLGQHLRKTHHFSLDSYNYHFHMQGNSKKARTMFERC